MLLIEADGPILRLTLNRPEARNALNAKLIAALTQAFETAPPAIRVVVLSGAGTAFCAGADLEWMREAADRAQEDNVRDALRAGRLFKAVANCPAAVVARAHGAAYGGGCGLLAAADVAVASANAKFAFSEVKLGLIPAVISQIAIAKIGRGHARALFATGEPFDAAHALRIGLVHEVAEESELDEAVGRKIGHILSAGPKAVAAAKRLALEGDLSLDECAKRLADARVSEEGREGVAAFLGKRKASFALDPKERA